MQSCRPGRVIEDTAILGAPRSCGHEILHAPSYPLARSLCTSYSVECIAHQCLLFLAGRSVTAAVAGLANSLWEHPARRLIF